MAEDWARPVVQWEIEARDPERLRTFYAGKIGDGDAFAEMAAAHPVQSGFEAHDAASVVTRRYETLD